MTEVDGFANRAARLQRALGGLLWLSASAAACGGDAPAAAERAAPAVTERVAPPEQALAPAPAAAPAPDTQAAERAEVIELVVREATTTTPLADVTLALLSSVDEGDDNQPLASAQSDAQGAARLLLPATRREYAAFVRLRASVGAVQVMHAIDPRDRDLRVELRVDRGDDGEARAIEAAAPGSESATLWAAEAIAAQWTTARRALPGGRKRAAAEASLCERAAAEAKAAEPAVAQRLRIFYLHFAAQRCKLAPEAIAAELEQIGASEPLWGLNYALLMIPLNALTGTPASATARDDFFARVIEQHPNPGLVGSLLLDQIMDGESGSAEAVAAARAAEDALKAPRFAHTVAAAAAEIFGPGLLRVGNPVPAFSARTPDGELISNESLRGRPYVLDFWGTWCEGCVEAMPKLHAAYAALNLPGSPPKGAAAWRRRSTLPEASVPFVSIAAHDDPAKVAAFRRDQWPMPWAHVIDLEGPESVTAALGVRIFPTALFVDAQGVIVQRDGDLLAGAQRLRATQE